VVTLLWSSSFVLIKLGLRDFDLAPLSFAGLRYSLAAAILLPLAWRAMGRRGEGETRGKVEPKVSSASPRLKAWPAGRVIALGLFFYTGAQGAQFVAARVMEAGRLPLERVVSHQLPLERSIDAINALNSDYRVNDRAALKIAIAPNGAVS
jgi:drug/metabolite transporter (DMT)-like permease